MCTHVRTYVHICVHDYTVDDVARESAEAARLSATWQTPRNSRTPTSLPMTCAEPYVHTWANNTPACQASPSTWAAKPWPDLHTNSRWVLSEASLCTRMGQGAGRFQQPWHPTERYMPTLHQALRPLLLDLQMFELAWPDSGGNAAGSCAVAQAPTRS